MERFHVLFPCPAVLPDVQPRSSARGQPLPLVPDTARARQPRIRPFLRTEVVTMDAQHISTLPAPLPAAGPASRYGVVPWRLARRSGLRIMLVAGPERDGWSVPAGPAIDGRAPFLAAALAAFEEAGIIGDIDTAPLERADGEDGLILFAMNVRGTLSHWKRQEERQRGWFSPAEAADRLGDPALAALMRSIAERPHLLTQAQAPAAP